MSPDRLVFMANQIGLFFASQSHGDEARAAADIADHLRKFWDPRMRRDIVAKVADGRAEGLQPLPRRAVALLSAD